METKIIDYILNEYEGYLESEYYPSKIDFFSWIKSIEDCDCYRKEVKRI